MEHSATSYSHINHSPVLHSNVFSYEFTATREMGSCRRYPRKSARAKTSESLFMQPDATEIAVLTNVNELSSARSLAEDRSGIL